MRDFALSSPAVPARLHERYGRQLPLTEPISSPTRVFASAELVTVVSR